MIRHERLKKQICFVLPEVVSMEKLDKIILIVEDDDVARSVLQLILRKYFSTVVTAANGEEGGLALCHEIKPDLVLADLAMPIVDGFTMINKLTEEHPEQAIVILTAYRDEADMVQGGHKVLYKPVDRCELLNAVASTLSIEVMD